jgi:hypothetical protein|tara:strand:- start:26952 stop:27080 length:129 start_codon:yes stop_codon:yes gene_type:complete
MKLRDNGYIVKHEFVSTYGMYRFIYPQMCPIYLTKEKLWDGI